MSSAMGVLSLLDEEDDALKYYALQELDRSVHDVWFQMGTFISTVEALYEDEEFPHRQLAALVASKVQCSAVHDIFLSNQYNTIFSLYFSKGPGPLIKYRQVNYCCPSGVLLLG